jgi:hypothetical protein
MGGVLSVKPDATIQEVVTLMLLNDYSQLAVMATQYKLDGAVSWRSLAIGRHKNETAKLQDVTEAAIEVTFSDDLIKVLPQLKDNDFVIVRGPKNQISGIVTGTDVVTKYGDLASPFLLIGQIDQQLRAVLYSKIDFEAIVRLCDPNGDRKLTGYGELTMGDYLRVLQNPECWAKLDWPLDRVAFVDRLDYVTEIRNNVMHFNPDPVPPDAVAKLQNFLDLIKSYHILGG